MVLNAGMLITGALLVLGVVSSRFSARLGLPVLVVFLGVGMLAGSDGLGGLAFDDAALANTIGSVLLAFILFDGGLQTALDDVRAAWRPSLSLATLGVALTAALTGVAAAAILQVPIVYGLLLGAIVSSTDAAAVLSVLRTSGIRLPPRLSATLEVESGSNDPMAIFLTVGLITYLQNPATPLSELALLFAAQFGVGAAVGVAVGVAAARTVNRVALGYSGLYPVLASAFGLLAFGLAAVLGGSGFLAVYLAGIVLNERARVSRHGIRLFHDALAWLSQIALFILLGMLSFPSRLGEVAGPGLLVAVVLTFVARPVAVWLSARPFGFRARELVLLSWGGLKGAVPITLATFPLVAGLPHSTLLFDVVFFVVLLSATLQGSTLRPLAQRLGIGEPADDAAPLSVEINTLRHMPVEIVEFRVAASARVAGQRLADLALPDGATVAVVLHEGEALPPRGATPLRPGDHVFIAVRSELVPLLHRLFDPTAALVPLPDGLQLAFRDATTLGQLHRFFGLPAPTWSEQTLGGLLEASDGAPVFDGPLEITPHETDAEFVMLRYDATRDDLDAPPVGLAAFPPPPPPEDAEKEDVPANDRAAVPPAAGASGDR